MARRPDGLGPESSDPGFKEEPNHPPASSRPARRFHQASSSGLMVLGEPRPSRARMRSMVGRSPSCSRASAARSTSVEAMPRPSVACRGDRVDCGRRKARGMYRNIHATYAVLKNTFRIPQGGAPTARCPLGAGVPWGRFGKGIGELEPDWERQHFAACGILIGGTTLCRHHVSLAWCRMASRSGDLERDDDVLDVSAGRGPGSCIL